MSEDNLYSLLCYIIYGVTLLTLTLRSENKLKTVAINLTILVLYSGLFLDNLVFNSTGGSGLAWLIYLMFFIGLHWLINLVGLLMTFTKKNRP